MGKLKIRLAKSPIGFEKSQGATARALGLNKLGQSVVQPDNDSIQGMVAKIKHLVQVSAHEEEKA